MRRTPRFSADRGVSFVEIAIGLPVFLLFVFFLLWFAMTYQVRTALFASLAAGQRLGITHADVGPRLTGDSSVGAPGSVIGTIGAIDTWRLSGSALGTEVQNFFSFGVSNPNWMQVYNYDISAIWPGYTLQSAPPEYAYSLAYIYEGIRMRLGSAVKYPCNPVGSAPDDGPGCLQCRFLNPLNYTHDTRFPGPMPRLQIATECRYLPLNFIVTPVYRLLSLVLGAEQTAPQFLIYAWGVVPLRSGG